MNAVHRQAAVVRGVVGCALMVWTLALGWSPQHAFGDVNGDPFLLFQQFRLNGDAAVTGNTLMSDTCDPRVNSVLLTESFGDMSGIPADAIVEGAYLFWSASNPSPDNAATLRLPSGSSQSITATAPCHTVPNYNGAYACAADVTSFVSTLGSSLNGTYRVSDVQGTPGLLDGNCQPINDPFVQAKFAGWSIIVVYSSPTERTQRDIFVYDGFRALDETFNSPGQDSFSISGFNVGNPPDAKLSFFALEGDRQLGIPPQNLSPLSQGGCPDGSCIDSLEFNGARLSNANNPQGNLFNGSVPGGFAIGVDLDTYDISSLVTTGTTSATIRLLSGDGIGNNIAGQSHGYGEYFLVNWLLLRLNRLAPNFQTSGTFKDVVPNEAGPGGTVFFTITVRNDGSLPANNVVITDLLDANFEYVANTTSVDGVRVNDAPPGASPLAAGLNLGTISHLGDNDRRITFTARVRTTTTVGTNIPNDARIAAAELPDPVTTNTVFVRVIGPTLTTPTKIAKDLNGGEFSPGDIVEYEVFVGDSGDSAIGGLRLVDDMSPFLQLTELPVGSFDTSASSLTGGPNGTGRIDVQNITIPPFEAGVFVRYKARILTVPELLTKGVDPADINGLVIPNQGTLSATFLAASLPTDDPSRPGATDATLITLRTGVDFLGANTRKEAIDNNGAPLVPGDTITYRISLNNRGTQTGTVNLTDDVPPFLTNVTLTSPRPEVSLLPSPQGANGTGRLLVNNLSVAAGQTVTIEFTARVAAAAPTGTVLVNSAPMTVAQDPSQNRTLVSPGLEIFNEPVLNTSTKTVVNTAGVTDFQPGDTVRYTLSITNTGSQPAQNLTVRDPVSAQLEAITPEDGGTLSGSTITWLLPDLAVGATATVHFTARIRAGVANNTLISNQAAIEALNADLYATDDPSTPADDDPTTFRVIARPDISLFTKTFTDDNGATAKPGDTITYTLSFNNTGRADATGITITDVVDAAFTSVSPQNGGIFNPTTRTITWTLGAVAAGASGTVRFQATLASALPVSSIVSNQGSLVVTGTPTPKLSDDPSTAAADDPTRFTIDSAPLLVSTKTVTDINGGAFQPGDAIEYTLTFSNTGDAPLTNPVITDPVPAGLTNVTPQDGGVLSGGTITWALPASLSPGTPITVRVRATIDPAAPGGAVVSNQARIAGGGLPSPSLTDDPSTAAALDPTRFTVTRAPDLSQLSKTIEDLDGNGEFRPGDRVRYTITVINSGVDAATNVQVTDTFDPILQAIAPANGGTLTGNAVTWTLPTLAAGAQTTLSVEATIAPGTPNATRLANQALATSLELTTPSPSDDPSTPATDDPTTVTIISRPDLSTSTKTFIDADGAPVRAGDALTWTITVTNSGTEPATSVSIADPIDANLTDIVPQGGGVFDPGSRTILWSIPQLDPGATTTVSFTSRVVDLIPNQTRIDNQATLSAANLPEPALTDDPSTAQPTDPTGFFVISGADLTTSIKAVSPPGPSGSYQPNDTVEYTISLLNTGADVGQNITVLDTIDPALTDIAPQDGGTFNAATRQITWNIAAIDVDELIELRFRARVISPITNGAVIRNQALIRSPDFGSDVPTDDPTTPADDDPTSITIISAADLTVATKTVTDLDGDGAFEPGDVVEYAITITNTGTDAAVGVTITDPIDANLTNVTPQDGGALNGNVITWTLPDLPAGASSTARFTATLSDTAINGQVIANQATVDDGQGRQRLTDDPSTPAPLDPTNLTVTAGPRLVSVKSFQDLNGGSVQPGDTLLYTITTTNVGSAIATNISLEDPLDPALTGVSPGSEPGVFWSRNIIFWSSPGLLPGQSATITYTGTVEPGAANGAVIRNQATLTADGGLSLVTDDPATPALNDPTLVVVGGSPDLFASTKSVRRVAGDGPILPGDEVQYTITVRNQGFADANNVVITDPIPSFLSDAQSPDGVLNAGNLRWDSSRVPALARVARGDTITLTFTARVVADAPIGQAVLNQAVLVDAAGTSYVTDDPATLALSDATAFVVGQDTLPPQLAAFSKTVEDLNGGTVQPGDTLRYTLRLRAGDQPASVALVLDPTRSNSAFINIIPFNGAFVTGDGDIAWSPDQTPSLALIPAGQEVILAFDATLSATLTNGQVVSNQAFITLNGLPDPFPSDDPNTPAPNDPTSVTINAPNGASLTASKTGTDINGGLLLPGDLILYTFVIENVGSGPTRDARLRDAIPTFTEYVPNSTTFNGQAVADGPGGASPLSSDPLIHSLNETPGVIQPGGRFSAIISMQVRVSANAPQGQFIVNQGTVTASELPTLLTDADPSTPTAEPTRLFIGDGATLTTSTKTARGLDPNGNGQIDVGEEIEYTILLRNDGTQPAQAVILTDAIPSSGLATFAPGSMTLDGAPLTDADDGDAGSLNGQAITLGIQSLPSASSATFRFRMRATAEGALDNQALIQAAGLPDALTDDPSTPAPNDPTRVVIGGGSSLRAFKTVQDVNGGVFAPGDALVYQFELRNDGPSSQTVRFQDTFSDLLLGLDVVNLPDGANLAVDFNTVDVNLIFIPGGSSVTFQVITNILDPLPQPFEPEVCNIATVQSTTGQSAETNRACFTIGEGPPSGSGTVSGLVAWDRDGDRALTDADPRLTGWRVEARLASAPTAGVVAAVESDAQGAFSMTLPAGEYFLRYYTERGVQFGRFPLTPQLLTVRDQDLLPANLLVDPQGITYESQTGQAMPGVQVFAYYDETDPLQPNQLVPPEAFAEGANQQGQITSRDGFYRFDLPPERIYRLEVSLSSSQTLQFPSVFLPPQQDVLIVDRPLEVVPSEVPSLEPQDPKNYYLRFALKASAGPEGARNNHIPLDPIQSLISLDKRVDRPAASVGDILTYRVTVQNRSNRDITFNPTNDPLSAFNGMFIQDELPAEGALRFADGSATAKVTSAAGTQALPVAIDRSGATTGRSILRFGRLFAGNVVGLDLPAGGRLELTYRVSVGIRAEPGNKYRNIATAYGTGNVRLSEPDTAEVRVTFDPILDQGVVLGKVFCDPNNNGYQDSGEQGVFHARVALDVGYYAMTDADGKYHFHDVDPGSHMIKIDTASLPPGSTLTTAESRVFYQTRGLPLKANFGVNCAASVIVDRPDIEVSGSMQKDLDDELRKRFIRVSGDIPAWRAKVEDQAFDLMLPTAHVTIGGAGPAPSTAPRLTLQPDGLSEMLVFNLAQRQGPAPARWKLRVVQHDTGALAREFEGEGAPPAAVMWNGTAPSGQTLSIEGGQTYRFWLDLIGQDDDFGRSAPGLFVIDAAADLVVDELSLNAVAGPLFDRRNQLTPRLKKLIEENRSFFSPLPDTKFIIEVHTDDKLPAFDAFDLTDQQLTNLRTHLDGRNLLSGLDVETSPKGTAEPFLPNLDEENMRQNRRVVFKQVRKAPPAAASSPDAASPALTAQAKQALINDYPVPFGDDDFDVLVPRPEDGLLVVDIQAPDGSRAIKAVRIIDPDAADSAAAPRVPVLVDPVQATVQVGSQRVELTLRDVQVRLDQTSYAIKGGLLQDSVNMTLEAPSRAPVRGWLLEVRSIDSGRLIYRVSADGKLPPLIDWMGTTRDGDPLTPGAYEAVLTVMGSGAGRAISPPARFVITLGGETAVPQGETLSQSLKVNGRAVAADATGALAFEVAGFTGEAFLIDLTYPNGSRLIEAISIPAGFERGASAAPTNDPAGATPASTLPDTESGGTGTQPNPTGITPPDPDGGTNPGSPITPPDPDGGPSPDSTITPPDPDTRLRPADPSNPAGPIDSVSPEAMPRSLALIRAVSPDALTSPNQDGFQTWKGHRLGVQAERRSPRFQVLLAQEAEANPGSPTAPAAAPAASAEPPPDPQALAAFGADDLDAALAAPGLIDLEGLRRKARAAQLKVALPPSDMKLPRNDLVVAGLTHPENKVTVNGIDAEVKPNGTFQVVVTLPDGASTLTIESADADGNKGRIEWPVEVASVQYFLMAFAEGVLGNADLRYAGANADNSTRLDNGALLFGQTRLYFKGRLKGSELGTDFFQAYQATAHFDSGKQAEFEEMFAMTIQPDEYYAVYGDTSTQVQEVNARGKLYLLVEADKSYLKFANFQTNMKGIEFFDYARSFYGLDVAFNKTLGDDFDTQARVFVAGDSWLGDGSPRLRHTFNYLRATGGSLYYLQNSRVLEGSEQVTLITRDPITGVELSRTPQTRNVDYTVRYPEGRILFKSPVQSTNDMAMLSGDRLTSRDTRQGNPVFIEVSYQYEADDDAGSTSWGAQARETFLDNKLSLGAGYVQEGRGGSVGGSDYQLMGVDAAYRYSSRSFAEVEYARNRSFDAFASLSEDGGLTYDGLQRRTGLNDVGNAIHTKAQLEVADLIDGSDSGSQTQKLVEIKGFFDSADAGFYSNRNALDRGVQRYGGAVTWFLDDSQSVSYKHDSVLTQVDDFASQDPAALKTNARRQNRVSYTYREDLWNVSSDYNHGYTDDYRDLDGNHLHSLAARFEYTGIRDLTFGFAQEAVLYADDTRLVQDATDRFTTSASASWQVFDDLAIEAVEKVRWNGENSSQLGIRNKISDSASTYIQQRLTTRDDSSGVSSTTVVGGEQRFGSDQSGRAFGEYQLEGGVSSQNNRAIMGIGKRWDIIPGLSVDTAYERTQIFGRYGQGDSSRDVVSVGWQLTRYDWVKVGSRFEFRYDQGSKDAPQSSPCLSNGIQDNPSFCKDMNKGGFDKYQVVSLNNLDLKLTRDLTFLARYNLALTHNLTLDATEQIDQVFTLGFALRPINYDLINILLKYTFFDQQRPLALEDLHTDRTQKHVVSLVPMIELPYGFQLINKLAWKYVKSELTSFTDGDQPSVFTSTLLYIFRLNYHIWRITQQLGFDLGAEYRFMRQYEPQDLQHGALLDLDLVIYEHLRIGGGYNFTHFSDNEFDPEGTDTHGWFFRMRGSY
jgi:uncharacterized repeat protein (TIGR01451 family)